MITPLMTSTGADLSNMLKGGSWLKNYGRRDPKTCWRFWKFLEIFLKFYNNNNNTLNIIKNYKKL